jgi:endonuclease/exonuclease/phosphatase (EEP) superfamily protein YafD
MRILGFVNVAVTILGALAFVVAVCGLAARFLPVDNHLLIVGSALAPYLMMGAPVAALAFSVARRLLPAAGAVALTVAAVATQLPLFVADTPPQDARPLRILSANLYLGRADPQALVDFAQENADVVALQELTPGAVKRLSAMGLDRTFPYRKLDARPRASGVGMWSRYPIVSSEDIAGYELAMVSARIRVDGVEADPTILVAHVSGPWPQPIDDWRKDMDRLPATMRAAADTADGGCVIVAGDFNATYDMRTFRGLLQDGYRDGAEQAGAGITPTYPANKRMPPLIAIDHVVTRNCTATTAHVVPLPGSDHRALVSTVAIPRRIGG